MWSSVFNEWVAVFSINAAKMFCFNGWIIWEMWKNSPENVRKCLVGCAGMWWCCGLGVVHWMDLSLHCVFRFEAGATVTKPSFPPGDQWSISDSDQYKLMYWSTGWIWYHVIQYIIYRMLLKIHSFLGVGSLPPLTVPTHSLSTWVHSPRPDVNATSWFPGVTVTTAASSLALDSVFSLETHPSRLCEIPEWHSTFQEITAWETW